MFGSRVLVQFGSALVLALLLPVVASAQAEKLDERARSASRVLAHLVADPKTAPPNKLLRSAVCIAAVPGVKEAAFGVGGTIPDPHLGLFVAGGAKVAENDNWGGDSQITNAGKSVGAFEIANAGSKDAMLLLTLAPGGYTVDVSGLAGTGGGSTLVEIYEVP
jgi:lipid-binding SYLF domain-containing protein